MIYCHGLGGRKRLMTIIILLRKSKGRVHNNPTIHLDLNDCSGDVVGIDLRLKYFTDLCNQSGLPSIGTCSLPLQAFGLNKNQNQ